MLHQTTMSKEPDLEPTENLSPDDSSDKKFRLGVPRLKKGAPEKPGYPKNKIPGWQGRNGLWTWILFGVAVILLVSVYSRPDFASKEISYSQFKEKIRSQCACAQRS